MTIDRVNAYGSSFAMIGWLVGLAYYNWFASAPPHVPLWGHLVLVIGGIVAASFVAGFGLAILAGLVTQLFTGKWDGSLNAYSWAAFASPVLAFQLAKWTLGLFASVL